MATDTPHSCWFCINDQCEVTIFGLQQQGFAVPLCPRCKGLSVLSTIALWQVSMIAGYWLKGQDVEYPKA